MQCEKISAGGRTTAERPKEDSICTNQEQEGEEVEAPECIPELEKMKHKTKDYKGMSFGSSTGQKYEAVSSKTYRAVPIQESKLPRVNGDFIFSFYVLAWLGGLSHSMSAWQNEGMWPPYQLFGLEEKLVSSYNPTTWVGFVHYNYWVPALSTVVYLTVVFVGPKLMENRSKPAWLKMVLVFWNAFLFLGSTLGAYRYLPPLIQKMQKLGMRRFLCGDGIPKSESLEDIVAYFELFCNECGAGCLWLNLFILSKIPEMLDTLFLVLGKKRIQSLHWWHHVSVLWFCWMNWAHSPHGSTLYAVMNITVHSVMYFWYFLAAADNLVAVGLKPGKLLSQMMTLLQIAQMIVGTAVTFYFPTQSLSDCYYNPRVNAFGVLIYTTYLILFVRFFIRAYCLKRVKKGKKQN